MSDAAELQFPAVHCVVCALSAPRHGGLCCAHRYDEQPRCADCPPEIADPCDQSQLAPHSSGGVS